MYSAFMELCENKDFDTAIACGVLEQMDPSKEFEYAPKWKGTTYSPTENSPYLQSASAARVTASLPILFWEI